MRELCHGIAVLWIQMLHYCTDAVAMRASASPLNHYYYYYDYYYPTTLATTTTPLCFYDGGINDDDNHDRTRTRKSKRTGSV